MKIKKLNLKNIRSYDSAEIYFPEGSLLLAGDVGSGKTSLLLAIEYALFGLQPGQTGSALLRNNKNLAEVSLELEIDGKEIFIERKLRRGTKTINNDYAAITIDGKKFECSITELKSRVLKILGYPSEFIKKTNLLFRYTVYTPQEQMKQIIIEDPQARLNILRYIFGIDKYKTIRENLQILLSKVKDDSKELQGEIKGLDIEKENLKNLKSVSILLSNKIKEIQFQISKKIKEREQTEKECYDLESKIKEKEKLETDIEKAKIISSSKKEQLNSINQDISSLKNMLSEFEPVIKEEELRILVNKIEKTLKETEINQLVYIQFSSEYSSLEQNMAESIKKRERIFKIDTCPTCLQSVPQAHKHNIMLETEKNIIENKKALDLLAEKRKQVQEYLENKKKEKFDLDKQKINFEISRSRISEIDKAKKKIEDLAKTKSILEKDIEILEKHQFSLRENIFSYSKYSNLHKAKQEFLKNVLREEKQIEISLAETKKELELKDKEINLAENSIKTKEDKKTKLSNILDLQDWLNNQFFSMVSLIEKQVMIKLRMEFSKLFSKWFYMITGEVFEVQLDESFTPLIRQGETEMDYSFLSGGERTAIALAYRLALNQTINSLLSQIKTKDIIILDEPTEGFSEAQIDKIRDVLSELKVSQLIVVSHEQKIEGFVDKIIRLKKDSDSSHQDLGAFSKPTNIPSILENIEKP
ncbi:AAA family ATPase [Candidatus Pacearchaeota archaeon]|nr:AAA family ATPase [Candidatus Pacearchaeota archaeon]